MQIQFDQLAVGSSYKVFAFCEQDADGKLPKLLKVYYTEKNESIRLDNMNCKGPLN